MPGTGSRTFAVAFTLLVLAHLTLVSTQRLYPFTDLPNHLAEAAIHRDYGDAQNSFDEFYAVEVAFRPNTFHILFGGLRIFPDVEAANRVLFGLYVLLLPCSVLLLLRRLGGNEWFSLLSFLLLYNLNISWGFIGFAYAIPLVLLLLWLAAGDTERTPVLRWLGIAVLFVLIYLMHALALVFALFVFATFTIWRHRRAVRAAVVDMSAALPVAVVLLVWWRVLAPHAGVSTLDHLLNYYRELYLTVITHRAGVLIADNSHLYEGVRGYLAAAFFSLPIVVPVLWLLAADRKRVARRLRESGASLAVVFVLCSFLCFFFLPNSLPNQSYLWSRFCVFFLLAVTILGGVMARDRLPRAAVCGLALVCSIHLIAYVDYFRDFSRENESFTVDVLPDDFEGKTLTAVIFDLEYRGTSVYAHVPNYHIIWNRGIATTGLMDFRFGAVRRKATEESLPRYHEWAARDRDYDGRYHGRVDYILTRGVPSTETERYLDGYTLRKANPPWSLFEWDPAQ